jgi:hypothetical protein
MASWDRAVIFDPEAQKLEKNATQGSAFRMVISSPERRRLYSQPYAQFDYLGAWTLKIFWDGPHAGVKIFRPISRPMSETRANVRDSTSLEDSARCLPISIIS